jgi:uncharacterized protein (TIGR00369 family)
MEVEFDGRCFGCGPLNEEGLRMTFLPEGEESVAEFEVPARYQSWKGVVHGGIVALLLDEAVGWAAWHRGHPGVTGKLEVRYRLPLRIGERIRLVGKVEEVRRTLVRTVARIERLSDGKIVAEATATLMEASPTASA